MRKNMIPRGIRNNNPLNIKLGNTWLGESKNPTDPIFEQFISMEYGLRAACILLRRYIRHYHRDTITDIINSWAPDGEQAVNMYINTVCTRAGITPDEKLLYEDEDKICKIIQAMAYVENGVVVDIHLIKKGYSLA